ncbi:MAG: HAMP domain-containing histidine kinase [Actinomycetota bacterium]|nr:HAMP domain-containing histidine kinase [Actinomycetota bacterium]
MGRSLRLRGHSLRFQIVVTIVVLLSVSFLAVGAATALAMRAFLLQRLDQQLAAAGDRYSLSLEHPGTPGTDPSGPLGVVQGQAAGTLGARVLNGQVTALEVVARSAGAPAPSAADRQIIGSLRPNAAARTVHLPTLGEYRVLASAGMDGDVLVTGLLEHPVDETVARLLLIEASVFGAALLITGAAATISVRLSLRPLHRVASTARAVSALPLSAGTVSMPERAEVDAPWTEAGQVATAFDHMLEHVESALREREASEDRLRHFIADASHELRTPVAVVRSNAEYARRVSGDLPVPVTQSLTRIMSESDRMGHLVDDLLLLARLDSGRELARERVDLTRLVLDAVSDARLLGPDHRWRLELPEGEVRIDGDANALHQVVANLLANARVHTLAGTTVRTGLAVNGERRAAVITVRDDGPGIPAVIRERIFDRFVRADSARAHSDGSGLGLSIVAAIVKAHGGEVEVASQPGSTTLTVRLSLAGRQ